MKTVLFVDDDRLFLRAIKKGFVTLHKELNVLVAENGYEALWMLERNPVDLVVLDLNMPFMDGYKLIRKIRRLHPVTTAIVASAYYDNETEKKLMDIGITACLDKPLDFNQLDGTIMDALAVSAGASAQRRTNEKGSTSR